MYIKCLHFAGLARYYQRVTKLDTYMSHSVTHKYIKNHDCPIKTLASKPYTVILQYLRMLIEA